jgi:ABC-type amino acid transport substrate-binding protein
MYRLKLICLAALFLAGIAMMVWPYRNYLIPIKVGVEGNYPPFTKTEADGSVTGFEIDLANSFCSRMRARCELVTTKFDDLIPKIQSGELDAVMASLTITEKRQKEVDFSDSYYTVPSAWLAPQGALTSMMPGTLADKKVAVLKGSPRESWIKTNYPELQIISVPKETDVYAELTSKRADIGMSSMLVAKTKFLNLPEGKGFAVVGEGVYIGGGGGVGVAVKKGNNSLRKRFTEAINQSIKTGEYKTLASRYFDFNLIDRK